jgi:hypothetical protein
MRIFGKEIIDMFERLTNRNEDRIAYTKIPANQSNMFDAGECYTGRIVDRIAAYEDTGLSPEEIKQVQDALTPIPFGRFHEIVEAEREGRLLVLPCKPGTKVYRVWKVQGRETVIDEYYAGLRFIVDHLDQFGKTVFLTREESGKALSGDA